MENKFFWDEEFFRDGEIIFWDGVGVIGKKIFFWYFLGKGNYFLGRGKYFLVQGIIFFLEQTNIFRAWGMGICGDRMVIIFWNRQLFFGHGEWGYVGIGWLLFFNTG